MDSLELRKLKDKGPFEHIWDSRITMYDKIPYERDITLSGTDTLTLISGNIIKYYRYKINDVFNIKPDKALN